MIVEDYVQDHMLWPIYFFDIHQFYNEFEFNSLFEMFLFFHRAFVNLFQLPIFHIQA